MLKPLPLKDIGVWGTMFNGRNFPKPLKPGRAAKVSRAGTAPPRVAGVAEPILPADVGGHSYCFYRAHKMFVALATYGGAAWAE